MACWKVDPPNDWKNTPPASPTHDGWLGAVIAEGSRTWPYSSEVVPTHADGWPDLLVSIKDRIEVTVEVVTNIRESSKEHPACRFSNIGCGIFADLCYLPILPPCWYFILKLCLLWS